MSEDQFTKLLKYVQEMRSEMNGRFDEAQRDREDIRAAVGELAA